MAAALTKRFSAPMHSISRRGPRKRFLRTSSALAPITALVASMVTGVPAYADPDAAQVARWQRFRSSYGLRDDASFARWVGMQASVGSIAVSVDYGTPLTRDEAQLLDERAARLPAQSAAVKAFFATQHEDLDGGMYFDQRRDGTLVVAVTRDLDQVRQALRAVPHPDKVEVVQVRHSRAELRAIQDAVADRYPLNGVDAVSTALDPRDNVVVVRVRSDVNTARAEFRTRFPETAIRVEAGDYVRHQGTQVKNSPPFRGGQAIGTGSDWRCSIGFIGHNGAGSYYAMTAGHCATVGSAWYQPCCAGYGTGLGVVDFNPYYAGPSLGDSGRIPIVSTRKSNQITRTMPGGGIYYYAITSAEGQGGDTVGETDCNAGAATNWDCGQITATSYDYYDPHVGRWILYGRKSTAVGNDGDSGGPHFHVPVAHGTHVGFDDADGTSVYSHIYDVSQDLYLFVYTG